MAALPRLALAALSAAVWLGGAAPPAAGHVLVVPAEGQAGGLQRYGIIVPGERSVPTTRVEVQFPEALRVSEVQALAGWRTTSQKDRTGRVVGAIWEGGELPPGQFGEFGVLARNPDGAANLTWKTIQTYQDGYEAQWIGPPGAEFPGAITRVRAAGVTTSLAAFALLVALAAAAGAGLAWRRAGRAGAPPAR